MYKMVYLSGLLKIGPNFSASLNHFTQNKYFLLCIKLFTLAKPDKFVWFLNGPVFGCPVPLKIDHLNIRLVQYSDVHCTVGT
jgi:hypothetical protein